MLSTESAAPLLSAIIGNLVADYLLQNEWMAINKKRSTAVCTLHCVIWTSCVLLFSGWPLWTAAPLFVSHFAQDRTQIIAWYMDLIGQRSFRTGPFSPWSAVFVDNVFHLWTLWLIAVVLG